MKKAFVFIKNVANELQHIKVFFYYFFYFIAQYTADILLTLNWLRIIFFANLFGYFVSPVPEKAPTMLRGYPLNSTAIHISWNSLPPSHYKEQLLGYRVRYRRVDSQRFTEANTTSNLTDIVVIRLAAQTRYEIEVNGFNENGHGPISKTFVIKTLPFGKLEINSVLYG